MIKKTTTATFKDGGYAGEYDWQGGIPLSVGETIRVTLSGEELTYKLVDKSTSLVVGDEDQLVTTGYWFELSE
jgi:hypothetical protein